MLLGRDVLRPLRLVLVCLVGLAGTGCYTHTVADGARAIFADSQLCTNAGITVTARPDLAPHAILKDVTPPPGVSLDSLGETYEISGCSFSKLLYVCGRPIIGTHADPFSAAVSPDGIDMAFNTPDFTLLTAHEIEGGRITSAVVCHAATQTQTVQ
jgi:hypothetical protein